MSALYNNQLDCVLGHLNDLDSVNLTILLQRLVRERRFLDSVFNAIREGILVIDHLGMIEYSNQSANYLLGIKKKDVGNLLLWNLIPELASSLNVNFDKRKLSIIPATREMQITYPENRFVRIYIVPFSQEKPSIRGKFILIISDVTEDKISTEELIENEKLSSVFMLAASIAHEIGNPLNSLNIHLQLIKRQLEQLNKKVTTKKLSESLNVCSEEVKRLDGIVNNFLGALKPRAVNFQDLNLIEILAKVLVFLKEELKNLGIRIEVALDQKIPIILGDRNQIKQLFFNVIKNAMEAMNCGGHIKINSNSDDEFVTLVIQDTGTGIAQEKLIHILKPYYTTKPSGNGLGMILVQRFMREHGGILGIDSKEGLGTKVTLQFPQKHRRIRLLKNYI